MIGNKKIFLIFILIFGFVLRLFLVEEVPAGLYWDEAAMALDAQSVAQTGRDHHGNHWLQPIYPSWGDYKLPGYILTAVPFFKVIKNNPQLAVRFPSLIAGSLTILVVYFFSREIFKDSLQPLVSELVCLTASFLLAVSPWHLQFSRAAFEANLALLFNSLALLFFYKAGKKKIYLILGLITTLAGIYSYYSARIVLPAVLLLVFLFFWKKNFKNIAYFVLFLVLTALLCLPLRFSPLGPQAEQFRLSAKNIFNNRQIINYSSKLIDQDGNNFWARKIHHRFLYQGKELASHFFDHWSLNFLLLEGDSNLRHSTTRIGVLLVAAFIGLVYGQYLLFKKNKKLFIFLNLSLVLSFLPASVPYETPHALRSLNGVFFVNIISGFGLLQLIKFLGEKKRVFCLLSLYLLIFIQFGLYLHDYYFHYPSRSLLAWQGGYKQVVEVVNKEYPQAKKIIFTDFYHRPYLYFLLYSDYQLKDFQTQRQEELASRPLDYRETKKIGKIEF